MITDNATEIAMMGDQTMNSPTAEAYRKGVKQLIESFTSKMRHSRSIATTVCITLEVTTT